MKKAILVLVAIALIFGIFAGCAKEEAAEAAEAAPAAAEPVVFKFVNGAEPESLDPAQIEGNVEHNIYTALFEGLVGYDPESLDAVPEWPRAGKYPMITSPGLSISEKMLYGLTELL